MKFFICKHCGNLVCMIEDAGVPMICCGETMEELIPGSTDGTKEKHVPVIIKTGTHVTVTVGSQPHPMTPEHYIEWIVIETKRGFQLKRLAPGSAPEMHFVLDNDEIIAAYEFCNIHGLYIQESIENG